MILVPLAKSEKSESHILLSDILLTITYSRINRGRKGYTDTCSIVKGLLEKWT